MRLSKYFSEAELTVTNTGKPNIPTPEARANLRRLAVTCLDPLRESIGAPIVCSSGYRSPAVNRAVGGSSTSQHLVGEAADITGAGLSPRQLCERAIALKLPFDQLILEFGRWVHISHGPRNRRQVLTAVKRAVNGKVKTVYLPGLQ